MFREYEICGCRLRYNACVLGYLTTLSEPAMSSFCMGYALLTSQTNTYICAQIYKTYHHSENICDREYTVTSAVQILMQDKSQA